MSTEASVPAEESSARPPAAPRSEWRSRLLLVTFSVFLGLLGCELAVRLVRPQTVMLIPNEMYALEDESYGLLPGFEGTITNRTEYDHEVSVNSVGLRGPEVESVGDALRVLALGDSFTFGIGVEDEETFVFQLADLFDATGQRAVAFNAGVPGYGVPDSVDRLARHIESLEPDLVVLALFTGNDLQEAAQPDAGVRGGLILRGDQVKSAGLKDWLYRHSHLYVLLKSAVPSQALEAMRARLGMSESRRTRRLLHELEIYRLPAGGSLGEQGREATDQALERLVDLAGTHDTAVAAIIIPSLAQIDAERWDLSLRELGLDSGEFEVDLPTRILSEVLADNGIPTLDLSDGMRSAQRGSEPPYFVVDRHWTPAGHRLAAEQLKSFLEKEGLLYAGDDADRGDPLPAGNSGD